MTSTLTRLAEFAAGLRYAALPADVVRETKRLLLDSLGCALAGTASEKGRWGLTYATDYFAGDQSSVIGFGGKLSVPGAAFVNAELINGLDFDAGMTPGHVSPFVIPASLALAEHRRLDGPALITALAIAHELSNRIGANLGTFRDIVDGKVQFPMVSGYSFSVFGGTAALARLEGYSAETTASALGLAGQMAPMQTHTPVMKDLPTTTAKYLMAGLVSQTELAAAALAKAGHIGDVWLFDREWGFPRFAGAARWDGAAALAGLGREWRFHTTARYKIYPCCRIMHGALDCLAAIIKEHDLKPDEIDHIHAYLEASCTEPVFSTRALASQTDAQFSVAYNLAVMAFGVPIGARWQAPETMGDAKILAFMDRIGFEPHPDYVSALTKNAQSRITRLEVTARGQVFALEKEIAKGQPSADPSTAMTDRDLTEKFLANADGVIAARDAQALCARLMALETEADIASLMAMLAPRP